MHKLKGAITLDRLLDSATMLLSLVSFTSTLAGIQALADDNFFIPIAFTIALQIILVCAVMFFKAAPWRAKLKWLLVYLLCVFISVGFGRAYWFQILRADDYAKEGFRSQLEAVQARLFQFNNDLAIRAGTLGDLAAYSQKMASLEKQNGGTCGGSPAVGSGPRMRLRNEDAIFFAEHNRYYRKQAETVRKISERIRDQVVDYDPGQLDAMERIVNRAVQEMNAVRQDPQWEVLKKQVAERVRQGDAYFERGGQRFQCPDKLLKSKAEAMLETRLPELQTVRFFRADKANESVYLAFQQMSAWPLALLRAVSGQAMALSRQTLGADRPEAVKESLIAARKARMAENPAQNAAATEDYPLDPDSLPLVFGLMVDLLLFITTRKGSDGGFFDQLNRLLKAPSRQSLLAHFKRYLQGNQWPITRLLYDYELRDNRARYLIVPTYAHNEERRQLQRLTDLCESQSAMKKHRAEGIAEILLPPWWLAQHPHIDRQERVNVYQIQPNFTAELLSAEFREENSLQPLDPP